MEILRNSGGRSYQFNKRIPRILNRNFEPGFTVDYAKKDLKLAMRMADSMDFPALVGNLVTQLYTKASADGYGDEDIGAVVKLFEQGLIESEEEVDEYFEGLRA
jgi:3-hydroxyisobutyrate dehydrogenase-like beta-hydroxyacid dehydrogenase